MSDSSGHSNNSKAGALGDVVENVGVGFANALSTQADAEANGFKTAVKTKVKELIGGRRVRPAVFWESITEAKDPQSGARIRVWRTESEIPETQDIEILLLVSKIPQGASMEDIFNIISTLDRVSAIELVDPHHNGAVKYLEW